MCFTCLERENRGLLTLRKILFTPRTQVNEKCADEQSDGDADRNLHYAKPKDHPARVLIAFPSSIVVGCESTNLGYISRHEEKDASDHHRKRRAPDLSSIYTPKNPNHKRTDSTNDIISPDYKLIREHVGCI